MRLSIRHSLGWTLAGPATATVQVLRLVPPAQEGLTVLAWRVTELGRATGLPGYEDGYGNPTLLHTRHGPHGALGVLVEGEVEMRDSGGLLRGAPDPLPPGFFLRDTGRTQHGLAVQALADVAGPAPEALMAAVTDRVALHESGAETAEEALEAGAAGPVGLSQLLVATCHAAGVPARCVSGYVWPGENGIERANAHGWAEVWVEGTGWIGFDPALRARVSNRHLRLAYGLDQSEAGPVRGIRRGSGTATLVQSVRVDGRVVTR